MAAPRMAVIVPTTKATCRVVELSPNSGASRLIRKPPALMIPACNSACTGVGAYSERGSQTCMGNWADLLMPPMKRSSVTAVAPLISHPGAGDSMTGAATALVKSAGNSKVPYNEYARMMPARNAASPTRKSVKVLYAPASVAACAWLWARR